MSAMDIDNDISTVLASLRSEVESSELIQIIYQLEDFYERKLWNQLTLALEEFYENPESSLGTTRQQIFNSFLSQFSNKLNQIKVVDFLLQSFDDNQACYDKLNELKASLVSQLTSKHGTRNPDNLEDLINNDESVIYVNLQIARYALLLKDSAQADEILESVGDKFENTLQNDFSSKINAAFYLTKCQYYKIHENYNLFYTNGLLYLSSLDSPLPEDQQIKFCYDLCISALLGNKIYNFGELILHDILKVISNPDNEYFWLFNMITYLNSGNLAKFNEWLKVSLSKSPFLAHHEKFLQKKIVIMSLLELVSTQPSKKLSFQSISEVTGTPLDDVEYLIINCFSLNLIKGYINQIDQILVVTWLQPRILNLDQVKTLYNHLVEWDSRVENLAKEVRSGGGTLWATG